jgi:tRNA U38,U39,U40 pseudouridine synthase TruA
MVAIEFHGDDFVFDEIRRVTGSAVAVAKGFH